MTKKMSMEKFNLPYLDGIGKIKINQNADNELITAAFEDYKT
jgi:3-dehydroquinate synthetase